MQCYKTINEYLSGVFPGRVIKIAVNAGLGCPNRDGTLGYDGCIYCNNLSFNPAYAANDLSGSITAQLKEGVKFNSRKGECYGYLGHNRPWFYYIQAAGSNRV